MERQRTPTGHSSSQRPSRSWQGLRNQPQNPSNQNAGLTWHPLEDHFVYASCSEYVSTITKRTIRFLLSDVSKHSDPIAPVLVVAKVIIQSCWKLDLEWNDAVPDDMSQAYTN